jgi:rhombotarget A family protien
MLKKSIGMALLCMAGHAYSADITVTTTEDIVKDDEECSLREAIEYVNLGLDKEGYMGCGGENSTANILLTEKKTYVLNSHLEIKASLSIKAISDVDGTLQEDERVLGLNNAHIHMQGKDNIFRVKSTDDDSILLTLKELDLEGCGEASCADQGGIIYNKGSLSLDYVKLYKGAAQYGGAIYSTGRFGTNSQSRFEIKNSLIEQNKAVQGGVFYAETLNYAIYQSVFKNNQTTQNSSSNLYSVPYAEPTLVQVLSGRITNSTFLKNTGTIIDLIDGLSLNNVTIVDNSANAVRLKAESTTSYLTNSIVLSNGNNDCEADSTHKAILQNNLVSASCGTGQAGYANKIWTETQVFAGLSSEGKCQSLEENKDAILCPYLTPPNSFLGYLRPRILLKYNAVEDSPIVNQGKSTTTTFGIVGCEAEDQRMIARLVDNSYCDRGSIEITVPTSGILVGQNILMGDVAKFSIANKLGDSDLIPKQYCQALVGDHPKGEAWQDGCLKIVQTKTESKGKTTIDLEGNVVYTPDSSWHGADIFEIQVITSSTRFNKTKPYLAITTQIVQEPKDNFEDKTVKTSGGAFGFISLLGLLGLVGLRRVVKG